MRRNAPRFGLLNVATHLGLLVVGLAVGLLGAEALVRGLDLPPHPLAPLHVGSYRLSDDPLLRYEYAPNLPPDHAAYDPMHAGLATNSLGFRDVERPREKPAGTVRILAIGDSTTLGLGIRELADTYPRRLEARLRRAQKRPVEVFNLGVGGYDPLQEVRLLKLRGLAFDPDCVLMLLTLNDLESGVDGGVYEALLRARVNLDVRRPGLWQLLRRNSRLVFFGTHRLRSVAESPRFSPSRVSVMSPLEEGLVVLRRLQKQHDFEVLVFLLPGLDRHVARYAHRARHRRMAAIAAHVGGIDWIDLLEGMAAVQPNLRLLSFDGMHPNRVGQAAVAELVYQELRKRGTP